MKKTILLNVTLLCMITTGTIFGKLSFDRLYGFFGKYNHEFIVEKEFELAQPGTLVINNTDGNITITTEWQRNTICLKAIKKTTKEEDLSVININANHDEAANELTINAVYDKTIKGCVDYQLIVPAQTTLKLSADHGSIKVNDAKGQVNATTLHGDIEINNTTNTVTAQTEENGSIYISMAHGDVKATTNKGNITIEDAQKGIYATTQKGNIVTSCTQVPATSRIVLNAEMAGAIELKLPNNVNATLHGKTSKGRLTSDHYITIHSFTTKLTKQARRDLEKQVNGTLGTGEADIRVTSNNGNIKILETKTS